MKFLTEQEQQKCGYLFTMHSKTIPDQTLSPKEILSTYTIPAYDELVQLGYYDDEPSFDSFDPSMIDDLTAKMDFFANTENIRKQLLKRAENDKNKSNSRKGKANVEPSVPSKLEANPSNPIEDLMHHR